MMTNEELLVYIKKLDGCGDGGCVIRRPSGMHTNGGCHCYENSFRMRQVIGHRKLLIEAIEKLVKR